jgi:hypothetical protein
VVSNSYVRLYIISFFQFFLYCKSRWDRWFTSKIWDGGCAKFNLRRGHIQSHYKSAVLQVDAARTLQAHLLRINHVRHENEKTWPPLFMVARRNMFDSVGRLSFSLFRCNARALLLVTTYFPSDSSRDLRKKKSSLTILALDKINMQSVHLTDAKLIQFYQIPLNSHGTDIVKPKDRSSYNNNKV